MPLSALSKIGVAVETTWGMPEEPVINIPVEPFNITFNYDNIPDQSLRGEVALNFGIYQGVFHSEGSIDGHFYPEEIGYLLYSFFGTVSSTNTTTPYQHTFIASADPPSLTVTEAAADVAQYMHSGMFINEFSFNFNAAEGLLDYSASFMGKAFTTTTATIPDATAINPFVGWMATVTKGTNTTYAKLIEFEATLTREVSLIWTARNSQEAYTAYVGPMDGTGSMTIIFDDEDDFENYINNTNEKFEIDFTQGTGVSGREFKFTANKMNYSMEPGEIDRSNVDLRLVLNWATLHNTTDNGPYQVLLKSSITSYT
jgi:hypothetical protein